jgi:hypothetical protein
LGPTGSLIFGAIAERSSVPLALEVLGILCIIVSLSLLFLLSKVRTTKV